MTKSVDRLMASQMFLEGILTQISAFAMSSGVEPKDVVARIVLSDGFSVVTRGVKVISPFAGSDWGMILPNASVEGEALIVREQDIFKVQLQLSTEERPIGFYSEA